MDFLTAPALLSGGLLAASGGLIAADLRRVRSGAEPRHLRLLRWARLLAVLVAVLTRAAWLVLGPVWLRGVGPFEAIGRAALFSMVFGVAAIVALVGSIAIVAEGRYVRRSSTKVDDHRARGA